MVGDAGFDLPAYGDYVIQPGEIIDIDTGIAVEIPEGFVGFVKGRSGLAFKQRLFLAHEGVIDCSYRGAIRVLLENKSHHPVRVSHGDRIAQLVIVPFFTDVLEETEYLDTTLRGSLGFGSTGLR
jgi:dUTP pyrophosphatase